jgi:hypothetical protein
MTCSGRRRWRHATTRRRGRARLLRWCLSGDCTSGRGRWAAESTTRWRTLWRSRWRRCAVAAGTSMALRRWSITHWGSTSRWASHMRRDRHWWTRRLSRIPMGWASSVTRWSRRMWRPRHRRWRCSSHSWSGRRGSSHSGWRWTPSHARLRWSHRTTLLAWRPAVGRATRSGCT